jgi:uncharacterized protein
MNAQSNDRLLRAVAQAAETLPEIQAAFLFGSRATGRARAESDIDVAVLLDTACAPIDGRTRLRRVLETFAAHVAADRLDVVILNDAPPALAFQVLKHGKLVFERDRTALHRFRVSTYGRHSDFVSTERFFREVTRRRALTKASRG